MASGGVAGSATGLYGSYIRLDWSSTANRPTNTSNVTINLSLVLGTGTSKVSTESGSITVNGSTYSYNNGTQSRGTGPGTYLIASNTWTIGHNADGTGSITISGSMVDGFLGTMNVGNTAFALDNIQRYAIPQTFTSSAITATGFTLSGTTNESDSTIKFSTDNGSTYVTAVTGSSSGSKVFTGLNGGTIYNCYMDGVDPYSGYNSYSSLLQVTTLPNNSAIIIEPF